LQHNFTHFYDLNLLLQTVLLYPVRHEIAGIYYFFNAFVEKYVTRIAILLMAVKSAMEMF